MGPRDDGDAARAEKELRKKEKKAAKKARKEQKRAGKGEAADGAAPSRKRSASADGAPADCASAAGAGAVRAAPKAKKPRGDASASALSATDATACAAWREKNSVSLEGEDDAHPLPPLTTFAAARAAFPDVAVPAFNECCKTFDKPSPIQAQAWPIVLTGRDMVGIAQTGSGKTLAFLLPGMAQMLAGDLGPGAQAAPRALVLAPTRELAMQSAKVAEQACRGCENLSALVVFGGMPKWEQRKRIEALPTLDVLVATPGRLLDFVQDKVLDLSAVRYLVLDEADRMLDMGFEKDVRRIVDMTAAKRQTVMFSATWPREIRELAGSFMRAPVRVVVGSEQLAASSSVRQHVEVLEPMQKERRLLQLLQRIHNGSNRIIVFALYKKEAARLEATLQRNGYKVAGVHGDKAQSAREDAVHRFETGETPVLVATDVASRGLDIKGVEYVVNVSFPLTVEDYVHRIGRTGRAGAKGEAYTFFTALDKHLAGGLQNVLREAGEEVPEDLARFGNTVKKKEHKLYGAHFKEQEGPPKEASHVTFDDSDSD